ncbi:MAG: acyltransferase [Xanthobacteraceae bacterium]|jgi:uncharacterized membrane protein YcfT|nr:acyltransferase [Xanthobacteraceae bacterium]
MRANLPAGRIDWVDTAKGFCIVFVVMMHSTLGVGHAVGHEGFMHTVVEFARPFRMPDFFMISGLFLALVIDRDWRTYLDRKVVHFLYFYVLWMTIQFVFKAPGIVADQGAAGLAREYIMGFIEPFGTLWFIYLLPVFFVIAKLTRPVPVIVVWLIAAALEIAPIETGWTLIDETASRFVYFYTGYVLAPFIFRLAAKVRHYPLAGLAGLALWAVLNGVLVFAGYATLPFVSLGLGLIGAAAVVSISVLLARSGRVGWLTYCGTNSIVIYLAFFLPMAATRTLLIKTGVIADVGVMSILVTIAGVIVPLCLFWLVRGTRANFLFERPARFWLTGKPLKKTPTLQPAE